MRLWNRKQKKPGKSANKANQKGKLIWTLIILALPLGFLLRETLQYYSVKDRMDNQLKETQQVKNQIAQLEKDKDKLKNADPATIEKQAREQMKYSRPGEIIYSPATTE